MCPTFHSFEKIGTLGYGEFGVVNHARRKRDGMEFALKVIPLESQYVWNISLWVSVSQYVWSGSLWVSVPVCVECISLGVCVLYVWSISLWVSVSQYVWSVSL